MSALVRSLAEAVELLGVDGIDLVQQQGYGTDNMVANDESSIQVLVLILYSSAIRMIPKWCSVTL